MNRCCKLAALSLFGVVTLFTDAMAQHVTGLAWMRVRGKPGCQVLQADDGLNRNIRAHSHVPMRGSGCPTMSRDGFPVMIVKDYTDIGNGWYQLDNGVSFNPNMWSRR